MSSLLLWVLPNISGAHIAERLINLAFLYEELNARGAYRYDTQLCALPQKKYMSSDSELF